MSATDRRFYVVLASLIAALLVVGLSRGQSNAPVVSVEHAVVAVERQAGRPLFVSIAPRLPRSSAAPPGALLAPLAGDQRGRSQLLQLLDRPEPTVLSNGQIISYYGSVYTPQMGILGAADLESLVALLEVQAARYDELNGDLHVVPALHFVYAVAQPEPTENGLYLQYAAAPDIERAIELAREHNMLLFIDLQIGRSDVSAELPKVIEYLREPHVHLALDPEFAVLHPEVPGLHLGSLGAADINAAQSALHDLVVEEDLPSKILIVHQFTDSMVTDGGAIGRYDGVELIIDMDGYGLAEIKAVKYERYATQPYAERGAIKLFFDYDPDLMSEEAVLLLEPTPAIVIYQ